MLGVDTGGGSPGESRFLWVRLSVGDLSVCRPRSAISRSMCGFYRVSERAALSDESAIPVYINERTCSANGRHPDRWV